MPGIFVFSDKLAGVKAYEFDQFGLKNLRLVDRPVPTPAPDEVLVRIRAASLNYRDLMIVSGTYNPRMKLPAIPFSDGAGEIAQVGKAVTEWKVGDRVCSVAIPGWTGGDLSLEASRTAIGAGRHDGVASEYRIFRRDALVRSPGNLSFDEASTLPCAALTAWHALKVSGGLQAGETVLTLGTGGVSVFALQFAKLVGARVIATSSSEQKMERLRLLGADETINYRETADWDRVVLEMTGGLGVDHVIEVGGTGTLQRSVKAVRFGGHIALIGALDTAGEFNPIPIFMKGIRMQGIFIGSRQMFEEMNSAIEKSGLRPVIDRTFEFGQAVEALEHLRSGAHFGKVVVRMGTADR